MPVAGREGEARGDKASWLKIAAQWQRIAEEADLVSEQAQQPRTEEKPPPHKG
jgi:hypothetical protein